MKVRTLQPGRIHDARLKAELSQEEVAYRLRQRGVSASSQQIRRWERGSHSPRASVIPAIADVLGVSIDSLYGDDDDDEEADSVIRRAITTLAHHGEFDLAAALQREASRTAAREKAGSS